MLSHLRELFWPIKKKKILRSEDSFTRSNPIPHSFLIAEIFSMINSKQRNDILTYQPIAFTSKK